MSWNAEPREESSAGGQETGPRYTYAVGKTSAGWVGVVGSERGLSMLLLPRPEPASLIWEIRQSFGDVALDEARYRGVLDKIGLYFQGEVVAFDEAIDPVGTPFQLAVWEALRTIPRGETRAYREVAAMVGNPRGPRAVGQAIGANPLGILVPCHRVVRSDGSLGGFGGGLELKRLLLALEGARVRQP